MYSNENIFNALKLMHSLIKKNVYTCLEFSFVATVKSTHMCSANSSIIKQIRRYSYPCLVCFVSAARPGYTCLKPAFPSFISFLCSAPFPANKISQLIKDFFIPETLFVSFFSLKLSLYLFWSSDLGLESQQFTLKRQKHANFCRKNSNYATCPQR